MKVFCLGAAGMISRESVFDLVEHSDAEKITIGDCNEQAGRAVVKWLDDLRVDFVKVDFLSDPDGVTKLISKYDIVMDGTTISLNDRSTKCIAEAGVHGVNLNGFGAEWDYEETFKKNGKICIPGIGMTPGLTNLMAMHAANQLDTIDSIRISHGAFRSIAFSPAIAETTRVEYDPDLPGRVVYENGEYIQVPPFAREREISLPEPFGTHPQWIIPHAETQTLPKSLPEKKIKLVEVRGTWPPQNMRLVRALYDWGFMKNDKVKVGDVEIGIMDAIASYLINSPVGRTTDLWGYALHIEVIGYKDGKKFEHVLTHTHPASDGSVKGWEKIRAYTRNVGIPMGLAVQMIMDGRSKGTGVVAPELALEPTEVFKELEKRQIFVHETIKNL